MTVGLFHFAVILLYPTQRDGYIDLSSIDAKINNSDGAVVSYLDS